MTPFSQNSPQSAGTAALDTLFGSSPGSTQSAPNRTASQPERPTVSESEAPDTQQGSDPGEHGRLGELPGDSQESPLDASSKEQDQETAQEPGTENWFEFAVTDDKGRRKVKVDLSNKDQLAKILPQAYGFRKMQAERDAASQKLKAAEPRLQELETQWQTLETTYQEGGIEGLVDLLGGKKGHFTEWRQTELEKEARYLNASAAEKKAMDLEQKLSKMERESAAREARAQEAQKQAGTAQEAAQLKNLESQIVPVFNKHRFAGTLGDPAREAIFDKAVWDQALSNLESLPDSTELTSAIVEKEFKTVATAFRASIGKQANQKAKEVIEKKKQNAQGSLAQAASRSFQKPSSNDQQMRANIQKGGIGGLTDALMNVLRTK
jgi:hypothetical protein